MSFNSANLKENFILGLDDMDEFGVLLVQRMIPCPTCALHFREEKLANYNIDPQQLSEVSQLLRNPEEVKQVSLTVCAIAALNFDELHCSMHPDEPVLLSHMVPDLLLSDLPPSMVLDRCKFVFEPNDESKLGTGGAGEVYKGIYDGIPIAVKKFHSSKTSRYSIEIINLTYSFDSS